MRSWLKKYWALAAGGIALIFGLVAAVLTLGQVRPRAPKRPKTPDVKIPDTPPLNTTPADDYETEKTTEVDDVEKSINERYSR